MITDILFNSNSSRSYALDLLAAYVSVPKRKKSPVKVPWMDGILDAYDGLQEPVYEQRTLTLKFRLLGKPDLLRPRIQAELCDRLLQIVTPDRPDLYWEGRPVIKSCAGRIGGELELQCSVYPWRLKRTENFQVYQERAGVQSFRWYNDGARSVVPTLKVFDKPVTVHASGGSWVLESGECEIPELLIPGKSGISGTLTGGRLQVRYREGEL